MRSGIENRGYVFWDLMETLTAGNCPYTKRPDIDQGISVLKSQGVCSVITSSMEESAIKFILQAAKIDAQLFTGFFEVNVRDGDGKDYSRVATKLGLDDHDRKRVAVVGDSERDLPALFGLKPVEGYPFIYQPEGYRFSALQVVSVVQHLDSVNPRNWQEAAAGLIHPRRGHIFETTDLDIAGLSIEACDRSVEAGRSRMRLQILG